LKIKEQTEYDGMVIETKADDGDDVNRTVLGDHCAKLLRVTTGDATPAAFRTAPLTVIAFPCHAARWSCLSRKLVGLSGTA